MLDAGASVAAISLALGLDGQVTRSLLEGPAHTPVVDPTEASRLWREGMRVTDIALAYGVHPLTVSRALTRAGVRRPCGNRRAPLPEREIAERRAAGESISALARAYGVSRPTIRLRLRGGRTGLDLDAIDLHDPELIGWRGGGPEVWE
jgi:transposase-like protein